MAQICTEINEWIEEEVSKPIEEWEEKRKEKCKKRKWWDPRGWFCWLVTYLVKVIRWIIVKVGKWVVRTVCKIISLVVKFIVDVLTGLWDVIAGIFTLDWRRILDGLIKIGIAIVEAVIQIIRIAALLDTVDYIIEEVNNARLRNYVRELLENKYRGDVLDNIKKNLNVDYGVFGFKINMTSIRTIIDSETPAPNDPNIPNLIILHENNDIDLKELAGFKFTEGFSNRKRYKTLKKGTFLAGGGGGEFDNPISEKELNEYISSRGANGPKFIILCMRDSVLETKLTAAGAKSRELGLIPQWEKMNLEVTEASHIVHNGFDTGSASSSLVNFLINKIGRKSDSSDPSGAIQDLCNPVAIGVFRYTDTLRGLSSCLKGSSSCQDPHDASGVTFIDNKPDIVWKYVPIHELGHFFGLCHTDGLDKVMYSSTQNSWFKLSTIPNLLLYGEPRFTIDEAKSTWDYIVEHYSPDCLAG